MLLLSQYSEDSSFYLLTFMYCLCGDLPVKVLPDITFYVSGGMLNT